MVIDPSGITNVSFLCALASRKVPFYDFCFYTMKLTFSILGMLTLVGVMELAFYILL